MLDELLIGGEIQETSKKNIIRAITAQDMLQEVCVVAARFLTYDNQVPQDDYLSPALVLFVWG